MKRSPQHALYLKRQTAAQNFGDCVPHGSACRRPCAVGMRRAAGVDRQLYHQQPIPRVEHLKGAGGKRHTFSVTRGCLRRKTLAGFAIGTAAGYAAALLLWWNGFLKEVFEPYVVVLNSLPKIAPRPHYHNMGRHGKGGDNHHGGAYFGGDNHHQYA